MMYQKNMEKLKLMNKEFTTTQINDMIYGENGLFERVKKKIKDLGVREVATITDKSTQNINIFIKNKHPKVETIIFYARALGIE